MSSSSMTEERQRAHELIDRLEPAEVPAAVRLLESMLDPLSRSFATAPFDDEPEGEEERQAVDASKEWFRHNPEGIPLEKVLADLGLTAADLHNHQDTD